MNEDFCVMCALTKKIVDTYVCIGLCIFGVMVMGFLNTTQKPFKNDPYAYLMFHRI